MVSNCRVLDNMFFDVRILQYRSLNGRHTGTTELPLTENGEKRIRATGKALVGEDRLICRTKLAHV